MIDTKKTYTIDHKDYIVVRTSEWYNDETTTDYWLHPGGTVKFSQLNAIGTVDDNELEEDDDMPTVLGVKVALNRYSKRPLTLREHTEWTLKSIELKEAFAVRHVARAKLDHEAAVKNAPYAHQRAEEEVIRAAKEVERRENQLAQLRVQIAEAHALLKNG